MTLRARDGSITWRARRRESKCLGLPWRNFDTPNLGGKRGICKRKHERIAQGSRRKIKCGVTEQKSQSITKKGGCVEGLSEVKDQGEEKNSFWICL